MKFFRFTNKQKNGNEADNSHLFDNIFADRQFFEIGDLPSVRNPAFAPKYIGVVMYYGSQTDFAICLESNTEFMYEKNKEIAVSYTENNDLFIITAKVLALKEINQADFEELNMLKDTEIFKEKTAKLLKNPASSRFIMVNAEILPIPKKHTRRQHFRIKAEWSIHFKMVNPDTELSFAQVKWISEQIFDFRHGYFKLLTDDISGGGFKSTIGDIIPEGTHIECIIETHNENAHPLQGITGKVLHCVPNIEKPGFYDVRVQFVDMNESAVEYVMKNMLATETRNKMIERRMAAKRIEEQHIQKK
jgi:c-di-GMP-binding flagellar brake protein YcgR